jgi:hypothetical protein
MRVELRRILIIAALALMGCEDYEFAPEADWPEDIDIDLDDEKKGVDGIPNWTAEIPAEGPFELRVTFDMSDADADVTRARLLVRNPYGLATRYDDCRIPGDGEALPCVATLDADPTADTFTGLTFATISVTVIGEALVGQHQVEVWVADRTLYTSNHLTAVVEVVDPGAG